MMYVRYSRRDLRAHQKQDKGIGTNFQRQRPGLAPLCHLVYSGRHRHPASGLFSPVSEGKMTE
jgi:hypothetical protein